MPLGSRSVNLHIELSKVRGKSFSGLQSYLMKNVLNGFYQCTNHHHAFIDDYHSPIECESA